MITQVQGKTLDQIVVSMQGKGHFTAGQAYVALSRVCKVEGLHILGFDATAIRANPLVHIEMQRLCNIMQAPDLPGGRSNTSDITIKLLNVRSYVEHLEDLKADTNMVDADVLCFVETHLWSGQKTSDTVMSNADITRIERPDQAKGGIMIQTRKLLSVKKLQLKVFGIEFAAATVCKGRRLVKVITVYRSPLSNSHIFRDNLQKLLHGLDNKVLTVMLGNFSFDLRSSPMHPILDLMCHNGYKQHVQQPTSDYESILDNVYTNGQQNVAIHVVDTYYSDHDTVSISLNI